MQEMKTVESTGRRVASSRDLLYTTANKFQVDGQEAGMEVSAVFPMFGGEERSKWFSKRAIFTITPPRRTMSELSFHC